MSLPDNKMASKPACKCNNWSCKNCGGCSRQACGIAGCKCPEGPVRKREKILRPYRRRQPETKQSAGSSNSKKKQKDYQGLSSKTRRTTRSHVGTDKANPPRVSKRRKVEGVRTDTKSNAASKQDKGKLALSGPTHSSKQGTIRLQAEDVGRNHPSNSTETNTNLATTVVAAKLSGAEQSLCTEGRAFESLDLEEMKQRVIAWLKREQVLRT